MQNQSQDQKARKQESHKARARIQWTTNPVPEVQSQKLSEPVKNQWASEEPVKNEEPKNKIITEIKKVFQS